MTTTMPKRGEGGLGTSDPHAPEWQRLYQEHVPRIYRIAAHRVGPHLAEDVVQDALMRAYRNRHSFDPSCSERGWLNAIASRSAIDALRHKLSSLEDLLGEAIEDQASPDNGEDEFFNLVRRQGIEEVLAGLNERHRQVLELVIREGWSLEQAAAAMGTNAVAVKSLLARAKAAFQRAYREHSERTGVFGAGAVGTAIIKLRMRVHRFVEHHAGLVSAAAVSVAVVGVAAVPTSLVTPTAAHESAAVSVPAAAGSSDGVSAGDAPAEASVSTSSDGATAAASGSADTSSVAPAAPAGGGVQVETEATVGRNGNGAEVGFTATTDGPQDDGTLTGGISSSDCSGMVTGAFCVVVETAEDASPPPTE